MNNQINNILKSWGKKNQKIPANNLTLKNEILSKAPFTYSLGNFRDRKRSLPWLSMALGTLSILFFVVNILKSSTHTFSTNIYESTSQTGISAPSSSYKELPYYNNPSSAINDKREFLKTNYNASIRTPNVRDMTNKIVVIIHGFNGRVDSINSNDKNGYISFVIPKNDFEIFKNEVRDLSWGKLITESINSQNLLGEKQSIEVEQKNIENSLASLKNDHAALIKSHTDSINILVLRSDALDKEFSNLQNEWQNATSLRRDQISARFNQIAIEQDAVEKDKNTKNQTYKTNLANLNIKISSYESSLKNVKERDKNLIDNVATVSGNISLDYVNIWQIVDIYVPGPLLAWILIFLTLISYWRYRISLQYFAI